MGDSHHTLWLDARVVGPTLVVEVWGERIKLADLPAGVRMTQPLAELIAKEWNQRYGPVSKDAVKRMADSLHN